MNIIIPKRKIMPGYIPPKEDELLSSWIYRLAHAHKTKPFSFTKYYFKESVFWNRDIDKFLYTEVIRRLTEITPLSFDNILEHHLISFNNLVFNPDLNPSFTEGITNLGIFHRMRKNNGLLACPLCLEKDEYFKKKWRLLTSIICNDCKCYLIDQCPNCHSPIVFQRLDIGNRNCYTETPIYFCWKCNFDLRKKYIIAEENSLVTKYQEHIEKTLKNGYCIQTQYSFFYFTVILNILRKSKTKSEKWTRVREAFINEFHLSSDEFYFDNLDMSLQYRTILLPIIYSLLEDFPNNFIPFCAKYSIRLSDFSKDSAILPFWFTRAFKEYY